jgi:hypothetical protein
MSAKGTKKNTNETISQTKTTKSKKQIEVESEEEEIPVKNTKVTAQKVTAQPAATSAVKTTKQTVTKKASVVVKDVTNVSSDDDEDESEDEKQLVNNDDSDEDEDIANNTAGDSESDDESEKPKEKKAKIPYMDLKKKYEEVEAKKIANHKKQIELTKQEKLLDREARELERESKHLMKDMEKAHDEEVKQAGKNARKKRPGNVNGGFNRARPVKLAMRKYLGLADDACVKLPDLMHQFSEKLKTSDQKEGQTAILKKETVAALGLPKADGPNGTMEIKFGAMMKFLSTFYEEENTTVEVEV